MASSDVDKAVMLNDFFVQCFNYSVPALDNWSSQDYDLDSSSCLEWGGDYIEAPSLPFGQI